MSVQASTSSQQRAALAPQVHQGGTGRVFTAGEGRSSAARLRTPMLSVPGVSDPRIPKTCGKSGMKLNNGYSESGFKQQ